MAASNLRFGSGVTSEVGMDFANMIKQMPNQRQSGAKVGVFTDKTVGGLQPMKVAVRSLEQNGVAYEIFDRVCTFESASHCDDTAHTCSG